MRHIVEYKNKKLKGVEHLNVRYLNGKSKQLLAWVLGGSLVFGMTGAGAVSFSAGFRCSGSFSPAAAGEPAVSGSFAPFWLLFPPQPLSRARDRAKAAADRKILLCFIVNSS